MSNIVAYASVILDISIDKTLDYGVAEAQLPFIQRGVRVEVPVRGRQSVGYVLSLKNTPDFTPVKPITKIISESSLIQDDLFELALWISQYYGSPLRDILKVILPSGIRKGMAPKEQLFVMRGKTKEELRQQCIDYRTKKPSQVAILEVILNTKKGILLTELLEKSKSSRSSVNALVKEGSLILDIVRIDRSPLINEEYFPTKAKTLNAHQFEALQKINLSLENCKFETHLLFGITGSGKTEVYLQAIENALKLNKGTIMLVPEISLTSQTIERFKSRFKEKIAILHHKLSDGERNDEWKHIKEGRAKIVVGARSAIFSPVINLGLIIVDEEHESSYKQNDISPCYHARDVAVMRGKFTNSTVILGSATPSLESYYNASKGKYTLSILPGRAEKASLPHVTIIDMKKEFEKVKGLTNFSDALISGIKKRQERGEQSILFLNRRGYHTILKCQECFLPIRCQHCHVSLTFHKNDNQLACHLCGFQLTPPPQECPTCKTGKPLKFRGVGTEQIETALHAILPGIRTLRIDADTTKHKGSHQKILRDFGSGKADVLIGTQMIAKGLHFPEVTLVGVLNSDSTLNIPDFRASETAFQLITQVAGRSGRGSLPGEVIIQTSIPENSTILHAAKQDYMNFYHEEIAVREAFCYPPFTRIAKIVFTGKDAEMTRKTAEEVRAYLFSHLPPIFELNPVIPCGHEKIKDHFRYQFLLKAPSMSLLNSILSKFKEKNGLKKDVKMHLDIDPSSTFF